MATPVQIIIPVYNEEEALPVFLDKLRKLSVHFQPIFVDNGSIDDSVSILRSFPGALIIEHDENRGYGGSLKTGIRAATSEKIVIIDADGEYDPGVIPELVRELDGCDVVHTSRFLKPDLSDMERIRSFGNKGITRIFNLLFDQQLTDLYTGCKAYRRESVADLSLQRNGFEHVLEVSAKLIRKGKTIKEIPVRYRARREGVSKMNHVQETLKYLLLVVFYRFSLRKR